MILQNKVLVVTGVGTGLGGEIVKRAYRDGASVVLAARSQAQIEAMAAEVDPSGERVLVVPTDITSPEQCQNLVDKTIERFGRIDAFAQVAALDTVFTGIADVSDEEWRTIYEINVIGTSRLVAMMAPHMKANGGGSIILIGSQSSFMPLIPQIAYASSKGALMSAMYQMAKELGPDQIRVNTVVPTYMMGPPLQGYADHQAQERGITAEEVLGEISATMPLGKIPTDGEVAESVIFFASDRSSTITGQSLLVNSGQLMP